MKIFEINPELKITESGYRTKITELPGKGDNGSDGNDGIGITTVQATDNGDGTFRLKFNKSDGMSETVTTPNLKGDTGANSVVPGPQGPVGNDGADSIVAGPQGIQGPAGSDGADSIVAGPQGIQGPAGSDGADSIVAGPQGIQGPAGSDGADSIVAGPQGIQGPAGSDGADSIVAGPQGIQGPAGNDGADSVVAGPQGIQGPAGSDGADSIVAGPQGIQGPAGSDGADSIVAGPQGIQGPAGNDGTDSIVAGPQGIQGPAGNDGADSIVAGPQGIQGPAGSDGADSIVAGPQGIQGPAGNDGADADLATLNQAVLDAEAARDTALASFTELENEVFVLATLSNPLDAATGETTGSGVVTTDRKNGTLHQYISASNTAPADPLDIIAGVGAVAFGNQPVTAKGAQNTIISNLQSSTAYYTHYLHKTLAGLSNIVTAPGFTTNAITAPALVTPTMTLGALTKSGVNAKQLLATNATSFARTGGTANVLVSATGVVSAANDNPVAGTINVDITGPGGTVSATVTVTSLANTYHASTELEIEAAATDAALTPAEDRTILVVDGTYANTVTLSSLAFSGTVSGTNEGLTDETMNRAAVATATGGSLAIKAENAGFVIFTNEFMIDSCRAIFIKHINFSRTVAYVPGDTSLNIARKMLIVQNSGASDPTVIVQECRFSSSDLAASSGEWCCGIDAKEAALFIVEDSVFDGLYNGAAFRHLVLGAARRNVAYGTRANDWLDLLQSSDVNSLTGYTKKKFHITDNIILPNQYDPIWESNHSDGIQWGAATDTKHYEFIIAWNYICNEQVLFTSSSYQFATVSNSGVIRNNVLISENGHALTPASILAGDQMVWKNNVILKYTGSFRLSDSGYASFNKEAQLRWTGGGAGTAKMYENILGQFIDATTGSTAYTSDASIPAILADTTTIKPDADGNVYASAYDGSGTEYPDIFNGTFNLISDTGANRWGWTWNDTDPVQWKADIDAIFTTTLGNAGHLVNYVAPASNPSLVSSSPADEATNVAISADLTLVFDEVMAAGSGGVDVKRYSDDTLIETVPVANCIFTGVNVDVPLADHTGGDHVYVNYAEGVFEDLDGNPAPAVTGKETIDFTILTPIPTVTTTFAMEVADGITVVAASATAEPTLASFTPLLNGSVSNNIQLRSGATPTGGIGPEAAHEGSNYVFVESSGSTFGEFFFGLLPGTFDASAPGGIELDYWYLRRGGFDPVLGWQYLPEGADTATGWVTFETRTEQPVAKNDPAVWLNDLINLKDDHSITAGNIRLRWYFQISTSGFVYENDQAMDLLVVSELGS